MLLPLLLLALVAVPAVRAAPAGRPTHGGLALLHEIEDDVRELDGALVVRSTNDGALRELERRVFNERKEFDGLFKAAGNPKWFGLLSGTEKEQETDDETECSDLVFLR